MGEETLNSPLVEGENAARLLSFNELPLIPRHQVDVMGGFLSHLLLGKGVLSVSEFLDLPTIVPQDIVAVRSIVEGIRHIAETGSPRPEDFYWSDVAMLKKIEFRGPDQVVSSSCVAPDGTLYLGTTYGKIFTIDSAGQREKRPFYAKPGKDSFDPIFGIATNSLGEIAMCRGRIVCRLDKTTGNSKDLVVFEGKLSGEDRQDPKISFWGDEKVLLDFGTFQDMVDLNSRKVSHFGYYRFLSPYGASKVIGQTSGYEIVDIYTNPPNKVRESSVIILDKEPSLIRMLNPDYITVVYEEDPTSIHTTSVKDKSKISVINLPKIPNDVFQPKVANLVTTADNKIVFNSQFGEVWVYDPLTGEELCNFEKADAKRIFAHPHGGFVTVSPDQKHAMTTVKIYG